MQYHVEAPEPSNDFYSDLLLLLESFDLQPGDKILMERNGEPVAIFENSDFDHLPVHLRRQAI